MLFYKNRFIDTTERFQFFYIHPVCYGSTQCLGIPGLAQVNSDSIFVYLTPLWVTTDVRGNEQGRVEGHP